MNPTKQPSSTIKNKVTLRLTIVALFTALFAVTISIVIIFPYFRNSASIMELPKYIVHKNTEQAIENTQGYLNEIAQLTQLSATYFQKHILNMDDRDNFKWYCAEILRKYPSLISFNVGDEQGNVWGSERRKDHIINNFHILRQHPNDENAVLQYDFYDPNDTLVKSETRDSTYDPRSRPWYIGAKKNRDIFWTDTYVYAVDNSPIGITVSYPVFDKNENVLGIMAADFLIQKISSFLSQLSISDHSFLFIINEYMDSETSKETSKKTSKEATEESPNELIAFPDPSVPIIIKEQTKNDNGEEQTTTRLRTIQEIQLPHVAQALYRHQTQGENNIRVIDRNAEPFYVSFQSFSISKDKRWKIVFVVSENDFIGSIKTTNLITLVISLIILGVSIFIIMLISRRISGPIVDITEEANKITNFQFDGSLPEKSLIKEIDLASIAMIKLKTGIRAFSKYVPHTLVRQLIKKGQDAVLGGKRSQLTIFFSDIESFSTIAEKMPAENLMLHLSEYLNELTKIIQESQGTVDKYIGDAIMAFWGAPEKTESHAYFACKAAVQCKKALDTLNKRWEQENKPCLYTRIGVHTGDCIVGNMGSDERMNYTIIGDNVNLASRLEGVNKMYGTAIIISQITYEQVKDHVIVRKLDTVRVKGKETPIEIFELLDVHEDTVPDSIPSLREAKRQSNL